MFRCCCRVLKAPLAYARGSVRACGRACGLGLIVGLCLPLLMAAKFISPIQIRGLEGDVANNVEVRLQELAENEPLSAASDEELRLYVLKAMHPFGYFKPDIQIRRKKNGDIIFRINPGPPMLITAFSVQVIGEGQHNWEIQKALSQIPIQQGDILNTLAYEAAKQMLITAALNQGYWHAHFDKSQILIDEARYTAEVTLIFNTDVQYFFGQIRFDPTYLSPELLRRYLPFKPGEPYSSQKVQAFNNALSSSGYFKSVAIKPGLEGNSEFVPLNVHLEPKTRLNYSLGLGYGTDTGVRGQAGIHIAPVNPWGHRFNAVAMGSFRENALKAQYVIPGQNPLIDQYEATASVSTAQYDTGYSASSLFSLAERHTLSTFQRTLSLNSLYERFHYRYQPNEDNFSFYPRAKLTWLYKTNPLFSPNGYSLTLNGLIANKAVLSQKNFSQAALDAKLALTFEPIRTRLFAHTIFGVTQVHDIDEFPFSLAMLLGGSDNLKGFEYNSIGPGKIATYGGLEIQKETKPKWFLLAFVDAGDVYRPKPQKTRADAGAGLMWVSPIGPIKIELAQPFNLQTNRFSHKNPRLVVSMGPDL